MPVSEIYEFDKWDNMVLFGNRIIEYNFDALILMNEKPYRMELRYTPHALSQNIITHALLGCGTWRKIDKEQTE